MSLKRKSLGKVIGVAAGVLGTAFVGMKLLANKKKDSTAMTRTHLRGRRSYS